MERVGAKRTYNEFREKKILKKERKEKSVSFHIIPANFD